MISTGMELSSLSVMEVSHSDLLNAFLSNRAPGTLKAYDADLNSFRAFLKHATVLETVKWLLTRSPGEANLLAMQYRNFLVFEKHSPAGINRKLSALRSLIQLGKTLGLVIWELQITNIKNRTYRDTRGPGQAGVKALLVAAANQNQKKAARDRAILMLFSTLALRRAEIASLDLEHLDLAKSVLWVHGKGKSEREPMTVPAQTITALKSWLEFRGTLPGSLFINFDPARKGSGRLSSDGIYIIVKSVAKRANIEARPHGLRHSSITQALDLTGGDIRAVQKFSRHADVRTLCLYDDNKDDLAGKTAQMVADCIG